jgi:methylenetetrahydrofolate reductase (NADPH)
MIQSRSAAERGALVATLREAYMEVFPTPTIEERLRVLEPGAYVAVTCSPSKGVEETLEITDHLARKGYRVIPHIAAKSVRGRSHLGEIMARLNDLPVDSIFVPGGDAPKPAGEFTTAYELLRAIQEFQHRFRHIGVASHPEGHPDVDDDTLLRELEQKQPLATYLVTQMCFDTGVLERWLRGIRERGIALPAYIGIPGVSDRTALMKISLRIGVGDSLRFIRRRNGVTAQLLSSRLYTPDNLLTGMAPMLTDPTCKIAGFHIFCFNQVERSEKWRLGAIEALAGENTG